MLEDLLFFFATASEGSSLRLLFLVRRFRSFLLPPPAELPSSELEPVSLEPDSLPDDEPELLEEPEEVTSSSSSELSEPELVVLRLRFLDPDTFLPDFSPDDLFLDDLVSSLIAAVAFSGRGDLWCLLADGALLGLSSTLPDLLIVAAVSATTGGDFDLFSRLMLSKTGMTSVLIGRLSVDKGRAAGDLDRRGDLDLLEGCPPVDSLLSRPLKGDLGTSLLRAGGDLDRWLVRSLPCCLPGGLTPPLVLW